MGGTAWGSPSAGGQRGITWEGDNLKTLGFCPGFTPTQWLELAAGGDHWSPWRGRIRPTAGLSAGEGGNRRRQDGSSFLAPQLSHPSRTREWGAHPRGLTQGSAPPEPAPAAAFSGLLVLISGCFLIKAIWGLRRVAESQDLLRINGKMFWGGLRVTIAPWPPWYRPVYMPGGGEQQRDEAKSPFSPRFVLQRAQPPGQGVLIIKTKPHRGEKLKGDQKLEKMTKI